MSDIDTAAADSLKVLDPERPIREADVAGPATRSTRSLVTPNGSQSGEQVSSQAAPSSRRRVRRHLLSRAADAP